MVRRVTPTRAEALLVERAEAALEAGLQYKVERIRAAGHPVLARAMEAGVVGAVSLIQLRERFRDDVLFLCSLARRAHAGEDPERLADENLARALRLRELALVAREKDPDFQPLLAQARDLMARRLPDLACMVAVEEPRDYDDLVRRAFPDRERVEALVEDNRVRVLRMVEHVAAHPHVLRVPRAWLGRLEGVGRDVVEWQAARVLKGLDEIYAQAPRPQNSAD